MRVTDLGIPAFQLADALLDAETLQAKDVQWETLVGRYRLTTEAFISATKHDPAYLTDTGLRASREPATYFDARAGRLLAEAGGSASDFGIDSVTSRFLTDHSRSVGMVDAGHDITPDVVFDQPRLMSQAALCMVNGFGAWDYAGQLADLVEAGLREGREFHDETGGARLALLAGCGAAATHRLSCRGLFQYAAGRTEDAVSQSFVWLRLATAELKRFQQPAAADYALCMARRLANSFNGVDGVVVEALALNLEALSLTRAGQRAEGLAKMQKAKQLLHEHSQMTRDESGVLEKDVTTRYLVQVRQNLATAQALSGDLRASLNTSYGTIAIARALHPRSLSESLSIHGLMLLRKGAPHKGLAFLIEASSLLETEPNPVRHAEVLRLIALAQADIGAPRSEVAATLSRASELEQPGLGIGGHRERN